jgi:hypothetical protein
MAAMITACSSPSEASACTSTRRQTGGFDTPRSVTFMLIVGVKNGKFDHLAQCG